MESAISSSTLMDSSQVLPIAVYYLGTVCISVENLFLPGLEKSVESEHE